MAARRLSQNLSIQERVNRRWFIWFVAVYGVFVALPFLAPVLMQIGAEAPGRAIYWVYSFVCHQLPERSFFLFGPKVMYSLVEIQAHFQQTLDPGLLRQYIGESALGWKVAWSDRMFTLYSSIYVFALLWRPFRKKIRPLPLFGFTLLALPMVIDGGTHLVSDWAGLSQGFRYSNHWLATLTGSAFPAWFYYGEALGSFNSWMRLVTGTLFGLGVAWFLFPIVERHFSAQRLLLDAHRVLREQLARGSLSPRSPLPPAGQG